MTANSWASRTTKWKRGCAETEEKWEGSQKLLSYIHKKLKPSVTIAKHQEICDKLKENGKTIKSLEHNNLLLKEEMAELQSNETPVIQRHMEVISKRKHMTALPTRSLLQTSHPYWQSCSYEDIPQRSTVEIMAGEQSLNFRQIGLLRSRDKT